MDIKKLIASLILLVDARASAQAFNDSSFNVSANLSDIQDGGCGWCPCLCVCKGRDLLQPCCNKEAAEDINCTACSGYPDGDCIRCAPGYTLQGGTTCKSDPGCIHKVLGECDLCRKGKTLINQFCILNPHCSHQKNGICVKCEKGFKFADDLVCRKKDNVMRLNP